MAEPARYGARASMQPPENRFANMLGNSMGNNNESKRMTNSIRQWRTLWLLLFTVLVAGCSLPGRDADLEAEVAELTDADEVVAISGFGKLMVTISAPASFEMESEERRSLAQQIAELSLDSHTDTDSVVIAFATVYPEFKHVVYAWRQLDGELQPIEGLGD